MLILASSRLDSSNTSSRLTGIPLTEAKIESTRRSSSDDGDGLESTGGGTVAAGVGAAVDNGAGLSTVTGATGFGGTTGAAGLGAITGAGAVTTGTDAFVVGVGVGTGAGCTAAGLGESAGAGGLLEGFCNGIGNRDGIFLLPPFPEADTEDDAAVSDWRSTATTTNGAAIAARRVTIARSRVMLRHYLEIVKMQPDTLSPN